MKGVQGGSSREAERSDAHPLAREAIRRRRRASEEMKGVQGGSSREAERSDAHPLAREAIRRRRRASEEMKGVGRWGPR